ncbi:PhzF family phenazine biosynthesis protein [Rhodanobacter umsongensis]|uniref:PhzF family phenazine biosynthesis protein n=1 Tax=Rhodanobacter umsongensis TaxID=633153 RepID=A0ABW0JJR6_9GAMM
MSPTRRFMQLDVFSRQPLLGNALAVVVDGDGLDDATMQAFARWTNLSETTFLLPPTRTDADYRVRIFTPRQELPFAGHPSVGSAYAAIDASLVPPGKFELVQECAAGLLPVHVEGSGDERIIHVQAPPARLQEVDAPERTQLAQALRLDPAPTRMRLVDNGPLWLVCDLHGAADVRQLKPDLALIAAISQATGAVGVSVFGRESASGAAADAAMAVRAFCPADGIPEDPVTGSANAAIMAFLAELGDPDGYGLAYRASQGREVARNGFVEVRRDAATGAISIGGACAVGIRGELRLD